MPNDLLRLAEACEAAAEGSRELSADAALAAGWRRHPIESRHSLIRPDGTETRQPPPDYTRSLDAAMSLVPEGCWAEGAFETHPGKTSRIEVHNNAHPEAIGIGKGRTPALAMLAAALRARKAMEEGEQ